MRLKFNQSYNAYISGIRMPQYAHKYDSGMDIFCPQDIVLGPYERITISTELQFEPKLPLIYKILNLFGASIGIELQVRPKSGRSKDGIDVELGTIDYGYRGFVGVTITNMTKKKCVIQKNEKICQIVVCPVFNIVKLYLGKINTNTSRGTGGFGSTGIK